jgi:hypothetical protein
MRSVVQYLTVGIVGLGIGITGWAQRPAQPDPRTPPRADQPNPEQPIRPSQRRLPRTTARPVTPGTDTDAVAGSTVFVRATQVVGMEVRESSGEQRIGEIADLLLTPDSRLPPVGAAPLSDDGAPGTWRHFRDCDLRLALIQIDNVGGNRVVVVPWDLLQFQGTYFILGFPQERIARAPAVILDDPRILQSDEWMQQVNTFFADDLQRLRQQNPGNPTLPGREAAPATQPQPRQPATGAAPGNVPRRNTPAQPGADNPGTNRRPNPGTGGQP